MNIIETNLQFNSNMSKRNVAIKRIILHHSGVSVLQSVETIHNYHKNTRGYAGIGYHFYVRKDGNIYRGRPIEYVGAHAYKANRDSIGICAEGNFNEEAMNDVQKNSIKELVTSLKNEYNISLVQGHRDTIATSCPGANYPFDEIVNGQASENTQTSTETVYSFEYFIGDVQRIIGAKLDWIPGPETLSKTITISRYKNNRHALVVPLQKYFYRMGYTEVGEADGIAGAKFEKATKHYQKDNGCVVDGEITARNKTWKKLLRLA